MASMCCSPCSSKDDIHCFITAAAVGVRPPCGEHGSQFFDAHMAGGHHDGAVPWHGAGRGTDGQLGRILPGELWRSAATKTLTAVWKGPTFFCDVTEVIVLGCALR